MAIHDKDTTRNTTDTEPTEDYFRLFGVNDEGKTYFYWSETPAGYAGYYGPNYDAVWGTLTCKNNMLPTNRVFIADIEMVRKLESVGLFHPCYKCVNKEWKRWKAEQNSK